MAKLKPVGKAILILVALAALFGIYKLADRAGLVDKIIPKSKQSGSTKTAKDAAKKGVPTLKVGINTWGGYASGVYFNKGFAASDTSRYYTEEGILVDIKLIDDFKAMRDAWKAGAIDILGLATADSLPCEIASLTEQKPKVFMQVDWSRGGDAIVAVRGINSTSDIRGKKIAVAIGTPSHSLLMLWLQAGGVDYKDVQIVGTDSGIQAAQNFKAGAVDVAVVWSPDDQDCVKAVPGSSVIFNTKTATNVIADIFLVKEDFALANGETLKKFMKGWFKGVAEINTNSQSKAEAAGLLSRNFNVDINLANLMIENARLSTYGDNMFFFGLTSGTGTTGEEIYNKMHRVFSSVGLAPVDIPPWRNITDSSLMASLNLTGSGYEAEGAVAFTAPTAQQVSAPAFANKKVQIQYETGSARLSEDGRVSIDMFFANTAKEFGSARIRIEGNTDSVGKRVSNMRLSLARANSVANYLAEKYGFDRNRFIIIGNGPDKPIASNDTPEGRAQNRRTEFELVR
jgi:NitT/TauT family transport system substrate-binding protein